MDVKPFKARHNSHYLAFSHSCFFSFHQEELESLEEDLTKEIHTLVVENQDTLARLKKRNLVKDKDIARLKEEETKMIAEKERVEKNIKMIEDRREQTHQSNLALVASLR